MYSVRIAANNHCFHKSDFFFFKGLIPVLHLDQQNICYPIGHAGFGRLEHKKFLCLAAHSFPSHLSASLIDQLH